jgi:hypothetical protein
MSDQPKIEWKNSHKGLKAEIELEGFTIELEYVLDYSPDLSWLGQFHTNPGPGRIDWQEFLQKKRHDRHLLGYYSSCNYDLSKPLSEEEREYVKQDIQRLLAHGDTWYSGGVIATAYKNGAELGSDSVWGVENDSNHKDDVAWECAQEAVERAKQEETSRIKAEKEALIAPRIRELCDWARTVSHFFEETYQGEDEVFAADLLLMIDAIAHGKMSIWVDDSADFLRAVKLRNGPEWVFEYVEYVA